jgi:hypothetical protein
MTRALMPPWSRVGNVVPVVADQADGDAERPMNTLPYRVAFERIRAEFLGMPGMRLTPEHVERLSGVDRAACKSALDDLVRAKFLGVWPNGSYGRLSDTCKSKSPSIHTDRQTVPYGPIRRAS